MRELYPGLPFSKIAGSTPSTAWSATTPATFAASSCRPLLFGARAKITEQQRQCPVARPALYRDIDVVARLRQRVIQRIVGGDLLPTRGFRAVVLCKADIAAAIDHAVEAGFDHTLIALEPLYIARLCHITRRRQDPIAKLFLRHIAEAAGQICQLVAAAALGREVVVRAHVMAEAQPARLLVIRTGQLRLIRRRRCLRRVDLTACAAIAISAL